MHDIQQELNNLHQNDLYRNIHSLNGIDFCSNDYLGFASLAFTTKDNIFNFRGAGSSRLIPGLHFALKECEDEISHIYNVESTLFFGSGYLANVGIIQAFSCLNIDFFSDEFIHASFIDGLKMTRNKKSIFRHNDIFHLEELLSQSSSRQKCILTESIFSMDGDGPNLLALITLAKKYQAFLVIDEAHATGVLGKKGLGLMDDLPYDKEKTIIIHTCGKALGCYGAYVTSCALVRELFINKARTLIYSTAISAQMAIQIKEAICKSHKAVRERQIIKENVQFAKKKFNEVGLILKGSHISFLPMPHQNKKMIYLENELKKNHLFVKGIRFPSVAKEHERLRITLKSFNTKTEITLLATALKEILG
jgi:8-amino-7-oxononanoate synthase